MKQISSITFFLYLFWFLLVIFLNLKGNITFGYGLGDFYYLLFLTFLTVLSLFFYLRIIKRVLYNKTVYLFIVYLIVIIVFFSLKLTLLRGAEFSWNGSFFL